MTTRFTEAELMQMRSVKKTAAVLFIVALYDAKYPGRAYRVEHIAADLDMDKRTVEKACHSLSASGKLIFDGRGYVLTAGGRAMFLGDVVQIENGQSAQVLPLAAQAQTHPEPLTAEVIDVTTEPMEAPEVEGVPDAQNVQSARLTVRRLFEAADGMEGFPDGADQYIGRMVKSGTNPDRVSPRLAICWMAHAYDQRKREGRKYGISTPGWFVVSKLTDPSAPKPALQYWEHPRDFLPDGFLAAVGLGRSYDCQACGAKFNDREDLQAHLSEKHPVEVEPEQVQPLEGWTERVVIGSAAEVTVEKLEDTVGMADVWKTVLRTLEAEMPTATFQTWVADTAAGGMHDNEITIVTRNAFARDWLDSRLTATVTRILCGLMGQDVTVRFVVRNHEKG